MARSMSTVHFSLRPLSNAIGVHAQSRLNQLAHGISPSSGWRFFGFHDAQDLNVLSAIQQNQFDHSTLTGVEDEDA